MSVPTFLRRPAAVALVGLALLGAGAGIYAEDATVTISGGALSVSTVPIPFPAIELTGADQTAVTAAGDSTWQARDSRGTGAGWHLTITAGDFSDGTHTLDISEVGSTFQIQLREADVTTVAGNTKPTSLVTVPTVIPGTGFASLTFLSAAVEQGMGTYNLDPTFRLGIPAETFVGSYTAVVVVTAVSGP